MIYYMLNRYYIATSGRFGGTMEELVNIRYCSVEDTVVWKLDDLVKCIFFFFFSINNITGFVK